MSRSPLRVAALITTLLAALASAAPASAAELPYDDSFGQGGSVFAKLGSDVRPGESPTSVEAPDGDIISALVTRSVGVWRGGPQTPTGLVVRRYDPWGAPDAGFGTGGVVTVGGVDGDSEVAEIRPLADGSVLVLVVTWNGWPTLVKLSPTGGAATRSLSPPDGCSQFGGGAALRSDGQVTVVWSCETGLRAEIAGLTGTPSAVTFSDAPEATPRDIALDAAGRILIGFDDFDGTTTIGRYSAAGLLDAAYGTDGFTAIAGDYTSLRLDPKGRLVVGTYSCCWGAPWVLHRLDAQGDPDASFGDEGTVAHEDERLGFSGPQHVRFAPGDKILVSGLLGTGSGNGHVVLRLLDDGEADESFGPGGIMTFDAPRMSVRGPAFAQSDGNVLVTVAFREAGGERRARAAVTEPASDEAELRVMRFGTARRQRPPRTETPQNQTTTTTTTSTSTVTTTVPSTSGPRTARTCLSRRAFTIRLRPKRLRSAVVRVAGKRVKVKRVNGRLTATVNLRKLEQATFKVAVVAKTRGGKTVRETRSYRTCRVGENGRKVQGGSTLITVG